MKISFANTNRKVSKNHPKGLKLFLTKFVNPLLFVSVLSAPVLAFDSSNSIAAPNGWKMVDKSAYTGGHYKNVHTYEKDGDFVALVDFGGGARVKMLQYQSGVNPNGHNLFWTNKLDYWWDQLPSNSSRVLVFNGQYFNQKAGRQTTFSYSVRSETWATKSGDPNAHSKPLRQIAFFKNGVEVNNAVDDLWVQTSAPDGILGRHPEDTDNPDGKIGRTHMCAMNYANGPRSPYPVLLIYIAKAKTQSQINSSLKEEWKCDLNKAVAMDGGGSTQLKLKSGKKFLGEPSKFLGFSNDKPGTREFPQAIGIFNDAN